MLAARRTDKVIKIESDRQEKEIGRGRNKDKGNKPPNLAVQNKRGVKIKVVYKSIGCIHCLKEKNNGISNYDKKHFFLFSLI